VREGFLPAANRERLLIVDTDPGALIDALLARTVDLTSDMTPNAERSAQ
jgi:hypothetical protein